MNSIDDLNPRPDDMVVVPENMELDRPDTGFPFNVYRMKFLHSPSIIRSGGYSMGFLNSLANTSLGQFFGIKPTEPQSPPAMLYPGVLAGESEIIHHEEDEPPEVAAGSNIVTGFITSMKAHNGMPDITMPLSSKMTGEAIAMGKAIQEKPSEIAGFYRYVRAKQIMKNPRMGAGGLPEWDLEIAPKGGTAFYIELDPANKTFAFSYALCHNNDNFNYEIARNICKGRFDDEIWYEVQNYDDNYSVVENISVAIHNFLYNRDSDVEGLIKLSSTPEADKVNLEDLKEIYKRI